MLIHFGGGLQKAFVPAQEVRTVETILALPFSTVVERVVQMRRVTCKAAGKCGLYGVADIESEKPGVETVVRCDRFLCKSPQLHSETAGEIRDLSDVYADVEDDGPFESYKAEEALRTRFSSEEK